MENEKYQQSRDPREDHPGTSGLEHALNPEGMVFGGAPLGQTVREAQPIDAREDQQPITVIYLGPESTSTT